MSVGQRREIRTNAGRHRKAVCTEQAEFAYPTFARCQHRTPESAVGNYTAFIGRVGALAVALGIGAAVVTGLGTPVAHADGTETSANDDGDKKPEVNSDPATTNEPAAVAPHPNVLGSLSSLISHALQPHVRLPQLGRPQFSLSTTRGSSGNQTNSSSNAPLQSSNVEDADPPTVRTTPNEPAAPKNFVFSPPKHVLPQPVHFLDLSNTRQQTAAPSTEPSPPTATLNTVQLASTGARQSLAPAGFASPQHLTPATQTQAEQAVATLPVRTVNVVTNFVASILSPFVAPGPTSPAPPPMLFAVLAFVRREVGRSFFNQTPHIVDNSVTTSEDTSTTINVLANDTDGDGDTLAVTSVTQPLHGTVVKNANGTLTYTPVANYNGTDTFTYTATDDLYPHFHGLLGIFDAGHKDTATVTVNVTAVNDAPVASTTGNAATVDEDSGPHTLTIPAGTDVDNPASSLVVGTVTQGAHGAVTLNPDGTVVYNQTDTNYNGDDAFTYTLKDPGGAQSAPANYTVHITPVNDAPVASPTGNEATFDEDSGSHTLTIPTGSDVDNPATSLVVSSVTQPPTGTHGTVTLNPDGTVSYTQTDTNYNGDDAFTYTIKDPAGAQSAPATYTVHITAVDDPTVAGDDTATVAEDSGTTTIDVLANDSDPDGPLTITQITQPTGGTVAIISGGTAVSYTPSPDYNGGPNTFTYTVTQGGVDTTRTVTVTVTPVNDPTVAVNDTATVAEDSGTTTVDVLANDSDPDGPLTITQITQPTGGTVAIINGGTAVSYTPNANFNGVRTFNYTVTQGGVTTTRTVTVTVTPVNDAPVLTVTPTTASGATPANYTASASDVDAGDTVTFSAAGATKGTVTKSGNTFTYTPDPTLFNGEAGADTFVITASDGNGGTDTETVTYNFVPSGTTTLAAQSYDIAAGADGKRTYAILSNGSVEIVNTSGATPVSLGTVPVGAASNSSIAVSADGKRAYVTSPGSNTVSIIDTSGPTIVVTPVTVGPNPTGVAVSDDGKRAFVTNSGSNTVTIIDTSDPTLPPQVSNVTVGNNPNDVAVSADGKRAFVSNGGNTVSIIDTSNPALPPQVSSVTIVGSPREIKVSDDGTVAIVYSGGSAGVSVIKTSPTGDTVTNFPNITSYTSTGFIAISDDGTRAFVTQHQDTNSLGVIDTTQPTPTLTWIDIPDSQHSVATNQDGSKAYVVSHDAGVWVVDTAAGTSTLVSAVGSNSSSDYEQVVVSDDGTKLVMTDFGNNLTVRTFAPVVV